MDKAAKKEMIDRLGGDFNAMKSCVLANFKGVNVENMTQIRTAFRQEGVPFYVVKNTVGKKASEGTNAEGLAQYFVEETCIAYSLEDEILPAKILTKFKGDKKKPLLVIKGGYVDGKVIDALSVDALSKMPGKQELLSMLVGTMNAPIVGFVRVLSANISKLMWTLAAIKDKKDS